MRLNPTVGTVDICCGADAAAVQNLLGESVRLSLRREHVRGVQGVRTLIRLTVTFISSNIQGCAYTSVQGVSFHLLPDGKFCAN